MEATSRQIAARASEEQAKEGREKRAALDAAAIAAANAERARIVALIRLLRNEYRLAAQRSTEPGGLASALATATQREAAMSELLSRLGEGPDAE